MPGTLQPSADIIFCIACYSTYGNTVYYPMAIYSKSVSFFASFGATKMQTNNFLSVLLHAHCYTTEIVYNRIDV